MNKKIIFILVAVIIIVGGAGFYYFKNQGLVDEPTPVASEENKDYSGKDCTAIDDYLKREACKQFQIEASNIKYLKEAESSLDSSKCRLITNSLKRDDCYLKIAEATLNISLCEPPTLLSVDFRIFCYDFIIEKLGSSACDNLKNQYSKATCITRSGLKSADESACEKIENSNLRDNCYISLAIKQVSLSLCEKISYTDSKYICYADIAKAKKDVSICNKIADSLRKNQCIYVVAQSTKDASICNMISGTLKTTCLTDINK